MSESRVLSPVLTPTPASRSGMPASSRSRTSTPQAVSAAGSSRRLPPTTQAAQAAGMTVTYFDAITPGQKDYTAALVKVGTGHPDVLFYTGYYPEFGLLAKEYVSLSPSFKLNGDSACADPSVIKVAGTAVTN